MSLNCETNDGFVCVNHKRSHRQRNRRKYKLSEKQLKLINDLKAISNNKTDFDFNSIESQIDFCFNRFNETLFLDNVFQAFNRCFRLKWGPNCDQLVPQIPQIICYGLGNYGSSVDSLYQLSLLLSLKKYCSTKQILIFDPIFTENEINFLEKRLLFEVIETNEQCFHSIDPSLDQMVMFFMPHCDKSLFNNILWSNWTTKKLKNIIIFGNSFDKMIETIGSQRIAKQFYNYLFEMTISFENVLIESKVENNFSPKHTFNDLSIHGFNENNLREDLLQNSYSNEKPIYEEMNDIL